LTVALRRSVAAVLFGVAIVVTGLAGPAASLDPPRRCAPAGLDPAATMAWLTSYRDGYFAGADLTSAVDLTDGRTAWLMGDTVTGDALFDTSFFVNNSVLVQSGRCVEELLGWSPTGWIGFLPPPSVGEYYWPGDGIVDGGKLHLFFVRYRRDPTVPLIGARAVGVERVVVDPVTWEIESRHPVPGGARWQYGTAVVRFGSHVYVYGAGPSSSHRPNLVVARAPAGQLGGAWRFWNGSDWVPDVDASVPVLPAVMNTAAQMEVIGGRMVAIGQDGVFASTRAVAWSAPAPEGPWSRIGPIFTIPDHRPADPGDVGIVYLGATQVLSSGRVLFAWNYLTLPNDPATLGDPGVYGSRFALLTVPDRAAYGSPNEQVRRLYTAAFGRTPDPGGHQFWAEHVERGLPLVRVADAFAASPEFRVRFGAVDDTGFVDVLYRNVLGRPADPEGRAWWVGTLRAGASRGSVLVGFSESAEFGGRADDPWVAEVRASIRRLYLAVLGREPDPAGLEHHTARVMGGVALVAVADGIARSPELVARAGPTDAGFVDNLYRTALGREPDPAGRAHWLAVLASGSPRGAVAIGFADGPEFRARVGG
jgi:hypothetical protein